MLKTAGLFFVAMIPCSFVWASPDWRCDSAVAPLSVDAWATAYLQAGVDSQPLFIRDWLQTSADQNRDGDLSVQEQNDVICAFSRTIRDQIGQTGALVGADGRVDWMGHLGADQVVSAHELRLSLSVIAEAWVTRTLAETPLADVDLAALTTLLRSGRFAISEPEMADQEDLLGADLTRAGQLQKQLGLAYILSELKVKAGDAFPVLLSEYLRVALPLKNFPYVKSVSAKNLELNVGLNQVTITEVGVPGANRYYLLHGTPVRLRAGQKAVWYQPSQQTTFMMTKSSAYPDSSSSVKLLRRKLARLCQKSADQFRLEPALQLPLETSALQARLQSLVDELADAFLIDTSKVIVSRDPLEGGATAYLDSQEGTITFSQDLIEAVGREVSTAELNRHVVFLVLQEFLHSVQHGLPDYEMNHRLYNAPRWAFTLFGDVGYREFYLGQPVERDAQALAGDFVKGLSDACASLN